MITDNKNFTYILDDLLRRYDGDNDKAENVPEVTWADKQLLDLIRILAVDLNRLQAQSDGLGGYRVLCEPVFSPDFNNCNMFIGWRAIVINPQGKRITETGTRLNNGPDTERQAMLDGITLLRKMQQEKS